MVERFLAFMSSNLGTKVISVIIAAVIWIIVLGTRVVEAIKEVPIEVITSAEVMPANDIPDKVAYRLSGPKAFLRAVLDRREKPIRVNLTGAKAGPPETVRFYPDQIQLPIGVNVVSVNPSAILVKLERVRTREVPVQLQLAGDPPEGFRIAETEVNPPAVRIRGPESKVRQTTSVPTVPIDVSELTEDFQEPVALELQGTRLQVEGELPTVRLEVQATSANFRIRNVDIRVLSSYKAVLSEQKATVLVRASAEDLKAINRNQVYATVDLKGEPPGTYTKDVKVRLPAGITLVRVIPDQVRVTLK